MTARGELTAIMHDCDCDVATHTVTSPLAVRVRELAQALFACGELCRRCLPADSDHASLLMPLIHLGLFDRHGMDGTICNDVSLKL